MTDIVEARKRKDLAVYTTSYEASEKAYTEWADKYDKDIAVTLKSTTVEETVKNAIPYIKNEESAELLDLAAGTGRVGENLLKYGYKGRMDALEPNAAMLKKAEEKGIYRKCMCYKVTPDDALPFPENSYDTATVSGAFCPLHMEPGCFLPIIKCVKPGGIIVFNSRNDERNQEYLANFKKFIEEMVKAGKIEIVLDKDVSQYPEQTTATDRGTVSSLFIARKL